MTDKEKLEMINLRNRVSNQREEIKNLQRKVGFDIVYIRQLENMIFEMLGIDIPNPEDATKMIFSAVSRAETNIAEVR